jgi:hypothetical protein
MAILFRVLELPVASHGSDQVRLACAAVDAQDGDQVALDRVHNPVREFEAGV